ncbi:hypothetical protein [Thalassospira profundimaris]|uniref:Uncharacterized protein n=1 Tax=Thalassospira profundimaris TaxID=502049 RepID=A0A367WVS6_9PROT|nr:hypothetical protein [Thalassospira profundimaris]RCK45309.1 hypothetical protein TH30_12015 [Thalassospira profundimaris]
MGKILKIFKKIVGKEVVVYSFLLFSFVFGILDVLVFNLAILYGALGKLIGFVALVLSVLHVEFMMRDPEKYDGLVFSLSNGRGYRNVDSRTLISSMGGFICILCWLFILDLTEIFLVYSVSYFTYAVLFVISGRGEERCQKG